MEPQDYPDGALVLAAPSADIPEGWVEVPPDHWLASASSAVAPSLKHKHPESKAPYMGLRLLYRGDELPKVEDMLVEPPPMQWNELRNIDLGPSGHGDNHFWGHETRTGGFHQGVHETCTTCHPELIEYVHEGW